MPQTHQNASSYRSIQSRDYTCIHTHIHAYICMYIQIFVGFLLDRSPLHQLHAKTSDRVCGTIVFTGIFYCAFPSRKPITVHQEATTDKSTNCVAPKKHAFGSNSLPHCAVSTTLIDTFRSRRFLLISPGAQKSNSISLRKKTGQDFQRWYTALWLSYITLLDPGRVCHITSTQGPIYFANKPRRKAHILRGIRPTYFAA